MKLNFSYLKLETFTCVNNRFNIFFHFCILFIIKDLIFIMNFLKYQHFSNRHVNIEVPVMADPRTNILQNIYSQSNDEIWIDSWLQQNNIYHPIPKIKVNKAANVITIHEAQNSLKDCLKLLEKLSQTHQELESNFDKIPSTEWKHKTVEIGNIKDQFTKVISKFENGDAIFALKKTIEKRKKKRINQKKNKEFRKQQLEEEFQLREKMNKSIDQWLASKKEDDERLKMEEDMKKDADCVLAEVTKKKSDARKQMALIGSLAKLRFIRHHMALQRGEKPSLEDQNAFNITVLKLKNMWESSLKTYTKEEQGLKLLLEQTATEDTKTAELKKEKNLLEEWHAVFFGPRQVIPQDNATYWALTAAERDMETFIAIRKSWDTFLVSPTNEMGSKIPIGWVLPGTNENWSKYLATA
ncbi:programmed cell death protein 7-like [Diorhabda sublineata]|uniref:programmed cell death protein 7-like n=1 Tax=Diorhabda sublineata TaxID=1163346 RepID=UPI0024E1755C|nr:programmed cell death protein 7-like [Diorhabda sublineata]